MSIPQPRPGPRPDRGRLSPAPAVLLADVEWRIDSKPSTGDRGTACRFVPHVNARIAARLLDEWVGPGNWSDEYRTVTIGGKEAILCTVSIWNGERWVSKQDVGVSPGTEPQKGGISDAFKRCATVKWGCGRNVYDLPSLWAPVEVKDRGGKQYVNTNKQTLPELLRQLKDRGFTDDDNAGSVAHEDAENAT